MTFTAVHTIQIIIHLQKPVRNETETVHKLNLLHCNDIRNISRQDGNKFYVQSLNCEFVSSFIWYVYKVLLQKLIMN